MGTELVSGAEFRVVESSGAGFGVFPEMMVQATTAVAITQSIRIVFFIHRHTEGNEVKGYKSFSAYFKDSIVALYPGETGETSTLVAMNLVS